MGNLFTFLNNEKFFVPFTGVNKNIYYQCIVELIEFAKTTPILYESDVKATIEIFLANQHLHMQTDEELNFDESDSSKIIRKFRQCGWLSKPELGRNGEYTTTINMNLRRLILFLEQLVRHKDNAALSNRILSMYEIFQSLKIENSPRKDRPFSSVISPLLNDVEELKNEVDYLKESIAEIINQIMDLQDLAHLGHYFLSNQLLEKFFNDYFYMKNNGLIPLYLNQIADELRSFHYCELMDVAIKEYSELYGVDANEAKEKLARYLDMMFVYINDEYPNQMEEIDQRITKYYRLANLRIRLLTSEGIDLQAKIDQLLNVIKLTDTIEKDNIIDALEQCIVIESQKYISRKSYQIKRKESAVGGSGAIIESDLSEQEKMDLTQSLFESSINPYSIDRTNDYFNQKFKTQNLDFMRSNYVTTKQEALMFASAFIYANDEDFDFTVTLQQDMIDTKIGSLSNMIIRRKNNDEF